MGQDDQKITPSLFVFVDSCAHGASVENIITKIYLEKVVFKREPECF